MDAAGDERELVGRRRHPQVDQPLEAQEELEAEELGQGGQVDGPPVGDDREHAPSLEGRQVKVGVAALLAHEASVAGAAESLLRQLGAVVAADDLARRK